MLQDFVTTRRADIIARCRAKIAARPAPRATDVELEHGVPLFLDQLVASFRHTLGPSSLLREESAARHTGTLLQRGFTVAQVVHDYGNIGQTISELAAESGTPLSSAEFQALNACLDDSIASAVTEYGRLREFASTERLGLLAHELRNLLNISFLSFDMLKFGALPASGSTGTILSNSLRALRDLIDKELTAMRLGSGIQQHEVVTLREFIEDVEVTAAIEATDRGLQFSVAPVESEIKISIDRQILVSVISNLLLNAFKFTRPGSRVSLRARATGTKVVIEVEDECGGLPAGTIEKMFVPLEQ